MKIAITDLVEDFNQHPADWGDFFEIIKETIISHDSEKGSSKKEVIIKRFSDNKYFRIRYTYTRNNYEFEDFAYEVFPKTITTIIYEQRTS
jgi:hypothetical protein